MNGKRRHYREYGRQVYGKDERGFATLVPPVCTKWGFNPLTCLPSRKGWRKHRKSTAGRSGPWPLRQPCRMMVAWGILGVATLITAALAWLERRAERHGFEEDTPELQAFRNRIIGDQ